jgi:LPS-assembly lipoprotein
MIAKRVALARAAAVLTLALGGCGFHPLYAPSGATNAELSHIFVDIIPNRQGMLLRQALQERLEGNSEAEKYYVLSVNYAQNYSPEGVQSDSSISRNRYLGIAHWVLKKPGFLGSTLASGYAQSLDGNNNINSQFFYSDLQSDAINRRIGDALADAIAEELAVYFRTHGKPA